MKNLKCITLFFVIITLLLIIPNISNAAAEHTYSDTEQGIEWSYELDENNNVINLICNTTSKVGAVTIPSTIDGKTVISLSGQRGYSPIGAFENCAGITSITIPDTIQTIGNSTFQNCTGLKTITLPDSITKIDAYAFRSCSGLTSINLSNNLVSIGEYAFTSCTGLKNIEIPNTVTSIGSAAFSDCSKLEEITLSENLSKIANRTFSGCSSLTSIVLPNSVTTLESDASYTGAFGDCTNLEKILIPDSVATIGSHTFYNCNKLTIYGNDGMTSKEYAEANDIPFDYIANWDKENSGTDITSPTVESIEISSESIRNYEKDPSKNTYMVPAGAKLVINVYFNEIINGTTAPVLTIKFGDGQDIKLTEGTIAGSTISYTYTLQNSDKGVMSTVSLSEGNITDAAGNAATLSCPTLTIQYNTGAFVYANGNTANTDNDNNSNDDNIITDDNNNNGNNNNSTNDNNNTTTTPEEDDTTAKGKLPQAGLSICLSLAIILLISGCIFAYFKYNKLRDI